MDANKCSDLSVNFFLVFRWVQVSQALTVGEVPHLASSITTCCDDSSLCRIKATSCNLILTTVSSSKLWHELSVFEIPHGNETTIVSWDNRLESAIVEGKGYREFVRCLDFFLSFKRPKVDLSRPQQNVIGVVIEPKGSQSVFGPIANLIKNCLNANICIGVPNSDYFVGSKWNQVVPIFIKSKILNTGCMSVEITEGVSSERIPHNDMSLFSATGYKSVLRGIDKGIDTFLMKCKCLVFFKAKIFNIVNVDKPIKRWWDNVV